MNIKQIAKAAGVSVATVSRVINHPENVAPKTREKIQRVMEETEYKPNWFAQGLNFNKTKTIGLVIPHMLNPVYMVIAKGVEDVAKQKGYVTFMCNVEKDARVEKEYIDKLLTRRVDGIIMMFPMMEEQHIKDVEKRGVPLVLIGKHYGKREFNRVEADCRIGAKNMVRQLVENGHGTIGMLCGNDPKASVSDMLDGYREVLQESGILVREKYIKFVDNTVEGGYLGTKKMITHTKNPPKAIFATSDEIAYGALDAIKDNGLRVPDDIALAGFGNDRMSNLIEPKLSTVELPYHKMGIYGARLLLDLMESSNEERKNPKHIILQTKLRIRKSCGHKERIGEMF